MSWLQIKDGGEQLYQRSHTWPRTNRSLSWILSSAGDPYEDDAEAQQGNESDDTSDGSREREIWRIKDPLQRFCDPKIWQGAPPPPPQAQAPPRPLPAPPLPQLPAQAQENSSRFTDFTQYYTAPTSFHNTTSDSGDGSGDTEVLMQAVDRESGVFFQRICGSDGTNIQRFDQLRDGYSDELSYQLVPSRWAAQTAAALHQPTPLPQVQVHAGPGQRGSAPNTNSNLAVPIPSSLAALHPLWQQQSQQTQDDPTTLLGALQPSIMLTVPTPTVPQSPAFAAHSPITVSKFFSALTHAQSQGDAHLNLPCTSIPSDASQPLVPGTAPLDPQLLSLGQTSHDPANPSNPALPLPPPLPSCGSCGLAEFDAGLQCRACARRWLACKVWYRAQDGGRRRWLAAPYVRPAESNARNRAIMRGLGVPGCGGDVGGEFDYGEEGGEGEEVGGVAGEGSEAVTDEHQGGRDEPGPGEGRPTKSARSRRGSRSGLKVDLLNKVLGLGSRLGLGGHAHLNPRPREQNIGGALGQAHDIHQARRAQPIRGPSRLFRNSGFGDGSGGRVVFGFGEKAGEKDHVKARSRFGVKTTSTRNTGARSASTSGSTSSSGETNANANTTTPTPLRALVEFSRTLALGFGLLWIAFVSSWAPSHAGPQFRAGPQYCDQPESTSNPNPSSHSETVDTKTADLETKTKTDAADDTQVPDNPALPDPAFQPLALPPAPATATQTPDCGSGGCAPLSGASSGVATPEESVAEQRIRSQECDREASQGHMGSNGRQNRVQGKGTGTCAVFSSPAVAVARETRSSYGTAQRGRGQWWQWQTKFVEHLEDTTCNMEEDTDMNVAGTCARP